MGGRDTAGLAPRGKGENEKKLDVPRGFGKNKWKALHPLHRRENLCILTGLWALRGLLRHHNPPPAPPTAAGGTPPKLHSHWAIFLLPVAWRTKPQSSPGHFKGSECEKTDWVFNIPYKENTVAESLRLHISQSPVTPFPVSPNHRPLPNQKQNKSYSCLLVQALGFLRSRPGLNQGLEQ